MPLLRLRHSNLSLPALLLALVAGPRAGAAEATTGIREQILRVTDLLDTILPGTIGPRNLTLRFAPKFSDFRDREYVRAPLEVRYGVAERWDVTGGVTPFGPNPFNAGLDHRWGPGEIKVGVRHDLGAWRHFFDATTVGVETRVPVGRPPVPLNDHYTHVKPFVSATHALAQWPDTTFYANLSYDRSVELTHRDEPPAGVVRRNVTEAVPGLLYKPGPFGTFAEWRARCIADETGQYLAHEGRVGVLWDVPLVRSEQWRLPGKWQLELAYKHEIAGERGREPDRGVTARVTWRTTLREVLAGANGLATRLVP